MDRVVSKHYLDVKIGDITLRIMKITTSKAGDVYVIPRTSTGLHYSMHASGRKHVKDNFGYFRRVIEPTHELAAREFINLFQYLPKPHAILVAMDAKPEGVTESAPAPQLINLDLAEAFQRMMRIQFQRFRGVDLYRHLSKNRNKPLELWDLTDNKLVRVMWNGDAPVLVGLPLDFDQFLMLSRGTLFGEAFLFPFIDGFSAAKARLDENDTSLPGAQSLAAAEEGLQPWVETLFSVIENAPWPYEKAG